MSALRRLYVMGGGGGGGGGASDEDTPHRHHRHHHHHDKKDYTVTPTGGNVPVKIPSDDEERRPRHRRRRATAPAPQENAPLRVIDPEFEPNRSPLRKRSSVSSNATTSSESSAASSGGIEIRGDRRRYGGSPPLTPLITTTPPTPSPLEQARRANSQPAYRPLPPPYPVTPHRDGVEYIAYSPVSNMSVQEGPQQRYSDSAVPRRFPPHSPAVEIGSSDSIVQEPKRADGSRSGPSSPKYSGLRLDERRASGPVRRSGLANHRGSVRENQYDFLKTFDTVFVVDDSASMAGEYWDQLDRALETIAAIATKYDSDGIDIHFLNSYRYDRKHITSPAEVRDLFNSVQPAGVTPTGACLDRILREYLDKYAAAKAAYTPSTTGPGPHPTMYDSLPKPLNILVLTDGEATDDPETVIVDAARTLGELNAPLHQVGIQFVQIGNEENAREALKELDDALVEIYGIRDMVDFTPFVGAPGTAGGEELSAEMILKVLLGAVNRKYDRWENKF